MVTNRVLASFVALIFSASTCYADSLGSAVGGQAAPQSNMGGGLCLTSPQVLANGQQAGLLIDCVSHALIVTGGGGGFIPTIRNILTGGTDFATGADFSSGSAIFWNSPTAMAKTENLPICNGSAQGAQTTIVDAKQTAATYPITIVPNGADTINLTASYIENFNQQSVTIQCNGAGNWIVE